MTIFLQGNAVMPLKTAVICPHFEAPIPAERSSKAMSAADNIKCDICGNHHHPMTECRDALRSLASAAGSQIAVADLRDWISQLREKFGLPAKVKGRDKWWDGYEGAIQDLESFVSRQSENVQAVAPATLDSASSNDVMAG
jgi:hypothetical protein